MPHVNNLDFFNGRLKLRHLVIIIAVFENGSTVAAAEELMISQPTITRLLHEAEQTLKVPLFTRTSKGMQPTAYTEIFIRDARAALSHIRQGVRNMSDFNQGLQGEVVIGVHLSGTSNRLPTAIATFKEAAPQVTVQIRESTPVRLQQLLSDGELDMILTRFKHSASSRLPNGEAVSFDPLYTSSIEIVAHQDHALHQAPAAHRLEDLLQHPWVLPSPHTALSEEVEQHFTAHAIALPPNRVTCSLPSVIQHLVEDQQFLAVVPDVLLPHLPVSSALNVANFSIHDQVGILKVADQALSPAAAHFRAHLMGTV